MRDQKRGEGLGTPDLQVIPLGTPGATESGVDECRPESAKDQAVILADRRRVVLAFRGTEQWADWRTNLSIVPKSLVDGLWTHRGFNDALERQWPAVFSTVLRMRDNNQALWVTGHSLGGALAALAAERLVASSPPVQGVYTFGQPRLASEAVAESLNTRFPGYYRFVMHGDAVPGLGSPGAIHAGTLRTSTRLATSMRPSAGRPM